MTANLMISWLLCTLGRAIHQSSTFDGTTLQPQSSSPLPEQIFIAILELIIVRRNRSIWPPGLSCYNRKQSESSAQDGERRHGSSISQLQECRSRQVHVVVPRKQEPPKLQLKPMATLMCV